MNEKIKLLSGKELVNFWNKCNSIHQSNKQEWAMYLATKKCESPIEQIMAIVLETGLSQEHNLSCQFEIPYSNEKGEEKHYRTDFLLIPVIGNNFIKPHTIIECDGKDYHDKGGYVQRDRERDREICCGGYKIFRYSGSEIYDFYRQSLKSEHVDPNLFIYQVDIELTSIIDDAIRPEKIYIPK